MVKKNTLHYSWKVLFIGCRLFLFKKVFILAYEFADKHFAANVRANAINRKRIIHCALRVIEVRFNVDKEFLPFNVIVDLLELQLPIWVSRRVESVL